MKPKNPVLFALEKMRVEINSPYTYLDIIVEGQLTLKSINNIMRLFNQVCSEKNALEGKVREQKKIIDEYVRGLN